MVAKLADIMNTIYRTAKVGAGRCELVPNVEAAVATLGPSIDTLSWSGAAGLAGRCRRKCTTRQGGWVPLMTCNNSCLARLFSFFRLLLSSTTQPLMLARTSPPSLSYVLVILPLLPLVLPLLAARRPGIAIKHRVIQCAACPPVALVSCRAASFTFSSLIGCCPTVPLPAGGRGGAGPGRRVSQPWLQAGAPTSQGAQAAGRLPQAIGGGGPAAKATLRELCTSECARLEQTDASREMRR